MQTFYGLKEDETETITLKFEANPEPREGTWKINGVDVALGSASLDNNLQASTIEETGVRAVE